MADKPKKLSDAARARWPGLARRSICARPAAPPAHRGQPSTSRQFVSCGAPPSADTDASSQRVILLSPFVQPQLTNERRPIEVGHHAVAASNAAISAKRARARSSRCDGGAGRSPPGAAHRG
jgi:hypothetical protein